MSPTQCLEESMEILQLEMILGYKHATKDKNSNNDGSQSQELDLSEFTKVADG